MVNRYFDPKVFRGEFYKPPVEMLSSVMESAQKKFDQNYSIADEIKNRQINALDPDRGRANKIQEETAKQIDDLVAQYNGDYSKATAGLRSLLSNIRKQYQPGGEVATIEDNYNRYNTWVANEQKRVNEGKVTGDDFNLARERLLSNYTGIGEKDPTTGAYSQFNTIALSEYTDGSKLVEEALKGVKPKKISRSIPERDAQGNWFQKKEEVEMIDPTEVNNAIQNALTSDIKWTEYAIQKAQLLGMDPMQYIQSQIQQYTNTYGPLHSGNFNDTKSLEYKGLDDLTKLRMQQAHDKDMLARREASQKRLVDYKQQKEDEANGVGVTRPLEMIGVNPNQIQFKPIVPNETVEQYTGNDPIAKVLYGLPFVAPKIKKYPSVQETLSSGGKGRTDINYKLLQDIAKENKGKTDEQIWSKYNESLSYLNNHATSIMMDPYVQPLQQKQAADQLIPRYLGSNAIVYEIKDGIAVPLSAKDSQTKLSEMYDFKERRANVPVVGTTSTVSGGVPAGHVVTHSGKKYIIADNSTTMKQYNIDDGSGKGLKDKMFGHLRTGETYSDVFNIPGDDGKMIPTIGVLEYVDGVPRTKYYSAYPDPFLSKGDKTVYSVNWNDPWVKPGPGGTKEAMNEYDMERRALGNQYDLIRQRQKMPSKSELDFNFDINELVK